MTTASSGPSRSASAAGERIPVRVLGGPTVLIEYGGLRFLTDPTFDGPGDYPAPSGRVLTKTAPPLVTPAGLGPVDVVLLSHDQHADNLDHSGRALLADVPRTFTTPAAAGRLGGATEPLNPWQCVDLPRPDGGTVTVTAAPALHGPEGCEPLVGEVTGFLLTSPDLPAVYVSGDNASLALVEEIAARYAPVDTAVLFAGAPRLAALDDALLVLDGTGAAAAAALLGARRVVAAHCDSWAHFTEGREHVVRAFTNAGLLDRLQPADPVRPEV
ncbi:MBL fold metallo-hydrolase [Streptomyces lucensis JCM 4490]|uniref:MBL fold metallo-hydrolase n=1 Tax=Streptomyces lucensis JCM 4490 TaxID=1306176 RepID=A0A918MW59_9ACTN|nr:MBL fold metallo-hydrolase [Streptomyces lucensis]GGW77881.1 MBL fold metallo-hydrolase [Streptomyces lucensis JCM 4490]